MFLHFQDFISNVEFDFFFFFFLHIFIILTTMILSLVQKEETYAKVKSSK